MKNTRKMRRLLERMAGIERMERGKICRMTGRSHYNHQTWQAGRNVVRYVRVERAASLQEAIDGYALYGKLAEQYADEVIRRTRAENAQTAEARRRPIRKKQRRKERSTRRDGQQPHS